MTDKIRPKGRQFSKPRKWLNVIGSLFFLSLSIWFFGELYWTIHTMKDMCNTTEPGMTVPEFRRLAQEHGAELIGPEDATGYPCTVTAFRRRIATHTGFCIGKFDAEGQLTESRFDSLD